MRFVREKMTSSRFSRPIPLAVPAKGTLRNRAVSSMFHVPHARCHLSLPPAWASFCRQHLHDHLWTWRPFRRWMMLRKLDPPKPSNVDPWVCFAFVVALLIAYQIGLRQAGCL